MTAKKESPTGRKVRLEKGGANDRTAHLQYTAFRLDGKLPEAFSRLRKATPEPRLCVYCVPESIPHYRGGRWTI